MRGCTSSTKCLPLPKNRKDAMTLLWRQLGKCKRWACRPSKSSKRPALNSDASEFITKFGNRGCQLIATLRLRRFWSSSHSLFPEGVQSFQESIKSSWSSIRFTIFIRNLLYNYSIFRIKFPIITNVYCNNRKRW